MDVTHIIILALTAFTLDLIRTTWVVSFLKRKMEQHHYVSAIFISLMSTAVLIIIYLIVVDIVEFITDNTIRFII